MKLELPKVPETVTDQIVLIFALSLFGITIGMVSLALQEKPIPRELQETAKEIAIGTFAVITAKKLTI